MAELRTLIAECKEAVAAAKTIDRILKQPDCVDPEKQKLEERIAFLEARVDELEEAAPKKKKPARKAAKK